MLNQTFKSLIPPVIFKKIKSVYYDQKLKQAKNAIHSAGKNPSFLDKNQFLNLHNLFKSIASVSYEPEVLLARGEERANEKSKKKWRQFYCFRCE